MKVLKEKIIANLKSADLKYSIFIKDLKNNEYLSVNEKQILPSASIIKLFIMGAAFQFISEKKLNLNDRITIRKEEKVPYSIITLLDDKNSYTINDLITLMIIQSDNTATNKLMDIVGIVNINKFICNLGLKNTFLKRKMMDKEARINGKENLTNAMDVGEFLEFIYKEELISSQLSSSMKKILINQLDESMMRMYLPDEVQIAHKTGDLECIKHDAGIVYTKEKNYIFIMFTWETKSSNYARSVIGNISKIAYDYFTRGGSGNENN